MAPRAYWKGYLKLSLVSCPIALFPATSEREKITFHQLNKNTGHRIKYRKVDAESGDDVESADIIKGYEVGKGEYIELDPEELEAVAIEVARAHHCVGGARQGTARHHAAVSIRAAQRGGLFRRYSRREDSQGYARSRLAYRGDQGGAL